MEHSMADLAHLVNPPKKVLPAKKVLTLYVRRDDSSPEPARTIAVHPIPADADGITAEDLLNAGFAIDGDSAVLTVTPLTFVARNFGVSGGVIFGPEIQQADKGAIPPQSLSTALYRVQTTLVGWLRSRSYGVKFV